MVSHHYSRPAGAGPWHKGFAQRPHWYEEFVVQPELVLLRTNEDNQEFPFCEIALPVDVI